jgi:exonuclease I
VADIDFPDTLIELERTAWEEIQAGTLTVATAQAVQAAMTAFATEHGHDRHVVEMALKKAVRHPTEAV